MTGGDLRDHRGGEAGVIGGGELLLRVHDVEHVMRDAVPLVHVRGRRPDVHPAVELH